MWQEMAEAVREESEASCVSAVWRLLFCLEDVVYCCTLRHYASVGCFGIRNLIVML